MLNHPSFDEALAFVLASRLESQTLPAMQIRQVALEALQSDSMLGNASRSDLQAWRDRDPACLFVVRASLPMW